MSYSRTLVTCALPYANGPVHIGHLAGAYIPGDIYIRYLRMRGQDVVFVCGSDEHGVPITIKARGEGITPQDVVDAINQAYENAERIGNDLYAGITDDGIEIDMYLTSKGKITTAYPVRED